MDLVKMIADKAIELHENGTVGELVEKHTLKCIEEIVKDSFNWNGEAKKVLTEAIKEGLALPLEKVKVIQYQKQITAVLEKELNHIAFKNSQESLAESISKITGVIDAKEVKLSEIINRFKDTIDTSYHGGMSEQYGELTLHVEDDNDTFVGIYFDKESNCRKFSCSYQVRLHDGKIFVVKSGSETFTPFSVGPFDEFEKWLFTLYANNVTVIYDDYHDIELDYYREDYN